MRDLLRDGPATDEGEGASIGASSAGGEGRAIEGEGASNDSSAVRFMAELD